MAINYFAGCPHGFWALWYSAWEKWIGQLLIFACCLCVCSNTHSHRESLEREGVSLFSSFDLGSYYMLDLHFLARVPGVRGRSVIVSCCCCFAVWREFFLGDSESHYWSSFCVGLVVSMGRQAQVLRLGFVILSPWFFVCLFVSCARATRH